MIHQITDEAVIRYQKHLSDEEYAESTIQKYLRDIRAFRAWMERYGTEKAGETAVESERDRKTEGNNTEMKKAERKDTDTKEKNEGAREDLTVMTYREAAAGWKAHLVKQEYAPVTINAMLSSLNGLFDFLGWKECKVKFLKIQRRTFRDQDKELSRVEYERLLGAAGERADARLALLLETICSTGIRVSEVKYITMEALQRKRADISLKGKIRTILLPGKLCKKLRDYARKRKIRSGEIFVTKSGKSMCRRQIWGEMKKLCEKAKVNSTKVFPHNLRHLFARTFYRISKDIVQLADVLGHSNIETTRIYLISTGENHARQMNRLGLIS